MITSQSHIEQAQQARARDNQLIAQYMTGELTLLGIADMNNMTLKELIEWSRQPHIEALLSNVAEASTLRAQRLAADAAPHAIAKLTSLLSATNEEAARRAASAILRSAKPLQREQSSARARLPSQREGLTPGSPSHPHPEPINTPAAAPATPSIPSGHRPPHPNRLLSTETASCPESPAPPSSRPAIRSPT